VAFAEDLSTFFDPDEFADEATLDGVDVQVIFDAPSEVIDGQVVERPQVQIQSSQVPAAVFEAPLVITTGRGIGSYTVREALPDGTGNCLLTLTKVLP
jgi:hypothetical protein